MKPLIGIVEWPYLDKDEDQIYEVLTPIIEWVVRSGGRPIGLFPTQIENYVQKRLSEIRNMTDLELLNLKESIDICDAIIKPGALKIYQHERKIYEYALQKDIPYLGICAGMQVMAFNGKERILNEKNNSRVGHRSKNDYQHEVRIIKGTKLFNILNKSVILTNSKHSYHVPNTDLCISGVSKDGYIEAIENNNATFHIGTQWHPELEPVTDRNSSLLFERLIEEAKIYKKNRKI